MIFAAKALAMTAIDVFTKPEMVSEMREEFKQEEQYLFSFNYSVCAKCKRLYIPSVKVI